MLAVKQPTHHINPDLFTFLFSAAKRGNLRKPKSASSQRELVLKCALWLVWRLRVSHWVDQSSGPTVSLSARFSLVCISSCSLIHFLTFISTRKSCLWCPQAPGVSSSCFKYCYKEICLFSDSIVLNFSLIVPSSCCDGCSVLCTAR